MSFVGAKVIVKGAVQGVGFRYWTQRKAVSLGLCGEVGNLRDGTVRAVFEGDRALVEEFIKELKVGPTYSHVTDLVIEWYDRPEGFNDFNIVMMDKYD